LPGRRKIDILWGLVNDRNQLNDPPPLVRTDIPAPSIITNTNELIPYIFVSHNYRDFAQVSEIKKNLEDSGLNCWLYELGIEHESLIIPAVQDALKKCAAFLVFISKYSLNSAWVQKELEFLSGSKPIMFVLDGSDPDLIELVQNGKNRSALNNYVEEKNPGMSVIEKQNYSRIANLILSQLFDLSNTEDFLGIYPETLMSVVKDRFPVASLKEFCNSLD
jgi:hypothetical protein